MDATIGVETDEQWQRDSEWAKQVLAPFRDIPLTPEQERGLALWDIPAS